MKNIRYGKCWRLGICLVLMLAMMFTISMPALAAEKYMQGNSADFQIELDETGGAQVTETWDCYFGGDTITRYRRYFLSADGIESVVVQEVLMDGEPMDILDGPDDSRPEGCAAVWEEDGKVNVEMYLSAYEEDHTFTITYYASNAVILHDDVAEFRWNLTTTNEAFSVDTVTSHIVIPYGTKDHGLYFWAHGPEENASFDAVVEDGMVNEFDLYLEYVTPDSPAHVRFAMPLELFPEGSRYEGGEALDNIIAEETPFEEPSVPAVEDPVNPPDDPDEPDEPVEPLTFWDKVEYWFWGIRMRMMDVMQVWGIVSIIAALAPVVLYFLLSSLFTKIGQKTYLPKAYAQNRLKPDEEPEYYRSIPDDLKPSMVYKLLSVYPGEKDSEDIAKNGGTFAATIMDLIESGLIKMNKEPGGRIAYQLTDKAETAELTEYESILVNIYREAGAKDDSMTTDEITEYMHTNYSWCKDEYRSFKKAVDDAFYQMDLTVSHPSKNLSRNVKIIASIALGVFIYIGVSNLSIFGKIPALIMGVVFGFLDIAMINVLYSELKPEFVTLTQDGENRYAKWIAYARFLRDFTLFEEREVPDIAVWRKHLVYATALGCSQKVLEELRVRFPEEYAVLMSDPYIRDYDDLYRSAEEIDTEGAYTIRSSSSSSDSSDSGDSGWGDVSDSGGGGDYDSGGGGSDFD